MARRFRLRLEPYNPDARDADGDGIVQEGTAWERPAGTRIVNQLGEQIGRGQVSSRRKDNFFVVDKDGKPVDYIPSYAKQAKIPTERPKTSLEKRGVQTIKGRGVRNADEIVTEAVVLSRATSAPPPSPAGEPDPPTPSAPTDVNVPAEFGPQLISDLLPDIEYIKGLSGKVRKDGYKSPIYHKAWVTDDDTEKLFGWEETEEGRRAMDAIMEAGDRAVRALENYLADEELSDELRQELLDLHESLQDQKDDYDRIRKERHVLKVTAWLEEIQSLRDLLLPLKGSEKEKDVKSISLLNSLIKRIEKRIDALETSDDAEIITKKDITDLELILKLERTRRLKEKIFELDRDNYSRWISYEGEIMDAQVYAYRTTPRPDQNPEEVNRRAKEESERREEIYKLIKDEPFELPNRISEILSGKGDPDRKYGLRYGSPDFYDFIKPSLYGSAKDRRESLADRVARKKYSQELDDLSAQAMKPTVPNEARERLKSIDPLASKGKNRLAFLELLRSTRSDVGTGDFLGYFAPSLITPNATSAGAKGITKEMMEDGVKEASSILPGTWITRFRAHYDKPGKRSLKFITRGHFADGEIRLSGSERRGGWRSTLIHEVTHGFERSVPGLLLAEQLFYNRRAKKVGLDKVKRKYFGTGQWFYDLNLDDNYTSVYYTDREHFELATMSMEALYDGDFRGMRPDQLRWILGCILTL